MKILIITKNTYYNKKFILKQKYFNDSNHTPVGW